MLADLTSKQLAFNRRSSNTANAVLEVVMGITQSVCIEGARQSHRSASVSCKTLGKMETSPSTYFAHHLPEIEDQFQ